MSINCPQITVITICYNAESVIKETMLSVINQAYSNIEYIVIDGKSSDNTLAIVYDVKKQSDRKIVVISEKDNGIYDAINKGARLATGEWINCMNAGDCFASNTVLSDIVDSGLMNTASFIYSDFIAKSGNKQRLVHQSYDEGKILHQSVIYKRILHDKYGLYYVTHPYTVSDYLFFLQVPKDCYAKFNTPISINDTSGVSMQGVWMSYGRICADFMMRKTSERVFLWRIIICAFKCFYIRVLRLLGLRK